MIGADHGFGRFLDESFQDTLAPMPWLAPSSSRASRFFSMAALGTALHVWRFRYAEGMDRLREDALRDDEERTRIALRYRDMTERANDMITELDAEGNVLYANPAHEVILGFKPEFLIGRSCRDFFLRDGDSAVDTIADDGSGMEPRDVENAFDPFFSTRLNRGGTSLGLSVAHGVVTGHGGTLLIESEVDAGTKFTLRLPLAIPASSD